MSQGNSVTVDVSSGSKCHSGRNLGGRNVKAPAVPGVGGGLEPMVVDGPHKSPLYKIPEGRQRITSKSLAIGKDGHVC